MTFIKAPTFSPKMQFAAWTHTMQRSVLRQMIAVVSKPGITSFAGGLPDPALFPRADYAQALAEVLATDSFALQYRPPLPALKEHIVNIMAVRGVTCSAEEVFITTGAQQGLDILTRMLLDPGGEIILEEFIYTGMQQAVFPQQPRILTVPTDLRTGMDVDAVAGWLAQGARPAFIYAIPDAHNPLGVSMSLAKRQRLVELAAAYGIPIIEDDPYGLLYYDDHPLPTLRSMNPDWVFYLGSFSKIMAPALRLGWMLAPEALVPKLTVVKEMGDLESSALTQRAVAAYLDSGALPEHLTGLRTAYGARRDAMLAALYRYFPVEAQWTRPSAGMFVWVLLPTELDTAELLETAVSQEKVAFIPGHAFAIPSDPAAMQRARFCLRLNFTNCTSDQITTGIQRLAKVINWA